MDVCLPGDWALNLRMLPDGKPNLHYGNSLIKMVAACLAETLACSGCIVRDASTGWLGDIETSYGFTGLVSTPGTCVFAIHYDDLLTEEYVATAV